MRAPIAWLRDYVDLPETEQIVERLAMLGFPVESVEKRPALSGVVVGRIDTLEPHPNADRLQVCSIDVGRPERLVIATAATNVAAGQIVPVATVGAKLVRDGAPLPIEPRTMRGVQSQGMLCSADELGFDSALFEDGILQLDGSLELGLDVVSHFRLSDDVLEVEITANRVDAMSMVGLARELGAAFGAAVREPVVRVPIPSRSPSDAQGDGIAVTIESPDCRRFVAQRFSGVEVARSPAWMRFRLALAGQRPIDSMVDISNFVMLEIGQPLHFYDAASLADGRLIVRDARDGESLETIDGEQRTLDRRALVIADPKRVQGLAGLRGAASSEVTPATSEIVVESACFAGPRIRRMGIALGLRTEASARHERGLTAAMSDAGAERAAALLTAAGASAHEPLAVGADAAQAAAITVDPQRVAALVGIPLAKEETAHALRALGFSVGNLVDGTLAVTPPYWRGDVAIAADIAEEVARVAGYDRIAALPTPMYDQSLSSAEYAHERELVRAFATGGYREVQTIPLQPRSAYQRFVEAGIAVAREPVEIVNPLSEDQRYLRYSLLPGLLGLVAKYESTAPLRIFELGHVFERTDADPFEFAMLAWAYVTPPIDEPAWRDSAFSTFKGEALAILRAVSGSSVDAVTAPAPPPGLHPGKTAALLIEGKDAAAIGLIDPRLAAEYGIERPVCIGLLRTNDVPAYRVPRYRAPSRFPSVERDVALVVGPDIPAHEIEHTILRAVDGVVAGARVFDEYRGPQIGVDKKSLAVRITFQREDATLTDEEVDGYLRGILDLLKDRFEARLRE